MKLNEFSNKAKLILIIVFLAGAGLIVFNSERVVDVGINPTQSPQPTLSPVESGEARPEGAATPSLSESPKVSSEPEKTSLPVENECKVTGCSGQICSDEEVVTTCEFKEEYACYKTAKCEQQEDGKCGWTPSEELVACLMSAWEKEGVSSSPQ